MSAPAVNTNRTTVKASLFRLGVRVSSRMGGFLLLGRPDRRSRKPLYLMSMPRSGSTWVGRILASHPDLYYHFEPLNPDYSPLAEDRMAVREPGRAEPEVTRYFQRLQEGNLFSVLSVLHQRPWRYFTAKRILVKDVYSMFSQPFLMEHEIECILLVRHPCQVAKSHVGRGILPPLHRLAENLEKAELNRELTKIFTEGLKADESPWFQMGLYWEMAHQMALSGGLEYFRTVIWYEDLVEDPLNRYEGLFRDIELSYPEKVKKRILHTTSSEKETYSRRKISGFPDPRNGLSDRDVRDVMRGVRFLDGVAFERLYPNMDL